VGVSLIPRAWFAAGAAWSDDTCGTVAAGGWISAPGSTASADDDKSRATFGGSARLFQAGSS